MSAAMPPSRFAWSMKLLADFARHDTGERVGTHHRMVDPTRVELQFVARLIEQDRALEDASVDCEHAAAQHKRHAGSRAWNDLPYISLLTVCSVAKANSKAKR